MLVMLCVHPSMLLCHVWLSCLVVVVVAVVKYYMVYHDKHMYIHIYIYIYICVCALYVCT